MMKTETFMTLLCCGALLGGCCRQVQPPEAPVAEKRLKVLSVGFISAQRDAEELKNRYAYDMTIIPTGGSILDPGGKLLEHKTHYWADLCGRSADAVEADIQQALERPLDVIILSSRPAWENYPVSVRDKIKEAVAGGTHLAVFGPSKAFSADFGAKWREEPLPKFNFAPLPDDKFALAAYRYGQGTVAVQNNYTDYRRGFAAPETALRGEHDYWFDRLNAVLESLVHGSPDASASRVCYYDADGQECPEPLPDGSYYGRLMDGGRVAGGIYREVLHPEGLAGIELQREADRFRVKLTWRGKQNSGQTILRFTDNLGRELFNCARPDRPVEITGKIPENSLTVINHIVVEYWKMNRKISSVKAEFTMPEKMPRQDFYFLTWNGAVGDTVRLQDYFRKLSEFGIDGFTNTSTARETARAVALANMLNIPYAAAFHGVTLPALFSAKWFEGMRRQVEDSVSANLPYGAFGFSLGDENYVSGFKPEGRFVDAPEIWAEFHLYLRNVYPDLEALNKAWRSDFKNWEDIRFAGEAEMFSYERPAPWTDYRKFVAARFIGLQKQLHDIAKRLAPHSYVGWEGGEQFSSYDGYDLFLQASQFSMVNVYARYMAPQMLPNKIFNGHCLRAFSPKDALTGYWFNGIDYPLGISYMAWLTLFSGQNSAWWWHSTFPEHESGSLNYDMRPTPVFSLLSREVKEIRSGAAAMLKHAEPEQAEVAIYYSADNWHASSLSANLGNHINNLGCNAPRWFLPNVAGVSSKDSGFNAMWQGDGPLGHYAPAAKSFISLVRDMNLDFRMIDRRQLGDLNRYRILMLPFVEAMSDHEADMIREFARDGGIVIADYRTGIRDEHGNFRERGILDDVFGIALRKPFAVNKQRQTVMVERSLGDALGGFQLPVTMTQSGLVLKGGAPLGISDRGEAGFVHHQFGKGAALFLGFDFYQYFELKQENREGRIRDFFRHYLYRHAGYPLYPIVSDANHAPVSGMNLFRFRDGAVYYTGILQDYYYDRLKSVRASVPVKTKGYIYDVRNHSCRYGDAAGIQLEPGKAVLLAVYPYRIKAPEIEAMDRKNTFSIRIPVRQPAAHTVRIQVFGPDHKERPHYGKVLYLAKGAGEFNLPFALNDDPGAWTIEVTEAASGLKTQCRISRSSTQTFSPKESMHVQLGSDVSSDVF